MSKKINFQSDIKANLELDGKGLATLEVLKVVDIKKSTHGTFSISTDDLKDIVKNFEANVYGLADEEGRPQLPLNFSHEKQKIAAGWIKELSLSEDEQTLIAKVELTKIGRERAENKEYIYPSAELFFEYFDPESQKKTKNVLTGVALTNIPFMKGLKAIQLSELDLNQLLSNIGNLSDEDKVIVFDKMRKMLNVSNNNQKEKQMTNKKEMSEGENKKILELTEKQSELEAKIALLNKEKQFAEMLAENKVVPAQKDAFIKGDMVDFAEKASNKNLNFDQSSDSSNTGGKDEAKPKTIEEAEAKIVEFAQNLCKDDKELSLSEALSKAYENNPKLTNLIYGDN